MGSMDEGPAVSATHEVVVSSMDTDDSPPNSPFHGFQVSEIPQPIIIKTEPGELEGSDDEIIVEVCKDRVDSQGNVALRRLTASPDVDSDLFHGFREDEIPRPIIVKVEPSDVLVERLADPREHDDEGKARPDVQVEGQQEGDAANVMNTSGEDHEQTEMMGEVHSEVVVESPPQPSGEEGLPDHAEAAPKHDDAGDDATPQKAPENGDVTANPDQIQNQHEFSQEVHESENDKKESPFTEKKDDLPPSEVADGGVDSNEVAGGTLEVVSTEEIVSTSEDPSASAEGAMGVSSDQIPSTSSEVVIAEVAQTEVVLTEEAPQLVSTTPEDAYSEVVVTTEQIPVANGSKTEDDAISNENSRSTENNFRLEESDRQLPPSTICFITEVGDESDTEIAPEDTTKAIVRRASDRGGAENETWLEMPHSENKMSAVRKQFKIANNSGESGLQVRPAGEEMTGRRNKKIKTEIVSDFEPPQLPVRSVQHDTDQEEHDRPSQMTVIQTEDREETVEESEAAVSAVKLERYPPNVQILEENGNRILVVTQDSDLSDNDMVDEEEEEEEMEGSLENREFTVIVDDDEMSCDEGEMRIESESIEDILAEFETVEDSKTVTCTNCRKCFVSPHYLRLHLSNPATNCSLCNTQCCSEVNLRNHQNLDCDLYRRKRNIDLIARETELMGRKPIEPEKYYNLPIESSDDESEVGWKQPIRCTSDQKYECFFCGQYVKFLHSHMKYLHDNEGFAKGAKHKCDECGILATDLPLHKTRRHNSSKNTLPARDLEAEIARCKFPGCVMYLNNQDEVAEHTRRDHSDRIKLACGMSGCQAIFENRGALRKHRQEVHPELEEFKPVDLEVLDPDREFDFTVACPVCEKKFKHKNTCTVHIKVHHLGWSKRKLYSCPVCSKQFENKKSRNLHHEAIHLGIRTICPICDKPVTRLDLHVRMVHTEMPEWPCPDCGKKFKRKFDLNRHRVTVHLGVRNFPCDLCGKRFADLKDMTRHKNAVHYGMKIKWNSRKHKEDKLVKRASKDKSSSEDVYKGSSDKRSANQTIASMNILESHSETHIELEDGTEITETAVILDPEQEDSVSVGEPQVLITADPDQNGGLRILVIQEDEEDDGGNQIFVEQDAER